MIFMKNDFFLTHQHTRGYFNDLTSGNLVMILTILISENKRTVPTKTEYTIFCNYILNN